MTNYHPQEIEKKWQKIWDKKSPYKAVDFDKKPKYYALAEFPYPSGEGLHIGHTWFYIIVNVLARKKRMSGFNVLYPVGWDAFGLPAENFAIKTGIHPTITTKKNTDNFRKQFRRMGLNYDWDREINTTDPKYYRWTQWIFLQFFKHGLAYKAETPVGWCPKCKIILANEEIVGGKCERCGVGAEYRRQSQWLLRITKYADRLADELDLVDYPDYVKKSQRDWIGRTEGIIIDYPVYAKASTGKPVCTISCYTTRPDTNFGATFIVIAPEHPILKKLKVKSSKLKVDLENYIKLSKTKSEMERTELAKEKTGVFTGSYALNRLTGKKMPIWVSDFVVLTAGTGMVVGVPAHDERDFAFAKKYKLEIVPAALKDKEKIIDYLVKKGWGKRAKNYHLRDWIFSRQHYWGEPIPIINCPKCGMVPVPEKDLPVELPKIEKYQPTDTGESPLAKIREWVEVACPECGGPARRETDTMPNWAGSSWYYLAFCFASKLGNLKFEIRNLKLQNIFSSNKNILDYWLPVDIYVGGAEHTTLHLLYSRFWHKFLNDIGLVPGKEPYAARRQHGIILGEDGEKMSKSRGNVINPDDMVDKFGADALRIYLMFMGPYDSTMPWSTKGLGGSFRFLNRIWRMANQKSIRQLADKSQNDKSKVKILEQITNKTIKKVGEDIEKLKHNTAIACLMEYVNFLTRNPQLVTTETIKTLALLLAPFAPFVSEEIWSEVLGYKFSVHSQLWPKFDPKLIKDEQVTIIIQVNGKLRGQINIKSSILNNKSEIEQLAKQEPRVVRHLADKKIKKVIFVPGRLINFVV